MKNLFLFLILFAGASVQTVSAQQKKEILLMEIHYIVGYSGIYLHWQDKETEFIDTEKPTTKTKIKEQGKILRDLFQRLYNEGWEIESSTWGYLSDSEVIQYVLTKD